MDMYSLERLAELRREEQERRRARAALLREAEDGAGGGAMVRRRLAAALIALATRLAPAVAARDARVAAFNRLPVTTE